MVEEKKETLKVRLVAIVGSNHSGMSDHLAKLLATHKIDIIEVKDNPEKKLAITVLQLDNKSMLDRAIKDSKPLTRLERRNLERNLERNCITAK